MENQEKELQHLYDKKGEGAIFRSNLRWTEQGEKPTKCFFNLEAKNFTQKTIAEQKISDDKTGIKDGDNKLNFYRDPHTSQFLLEMLFCRNCLKWTKIRWKVN